MIPPRNDQKVSPYSSVRKAAVKLDLNENRMGPSTKVIEAIRNVKDKDIFTYPDYAELTAKIAEYLNVNSKNVLLTNGADDAIRCVLDTYLDKGDKMLIPEPTFTMFEILGNLRGANIVKVPYNKDLSFPIEKFIEALPQKKVVVIVNPNNPTGTSITRDEIVKILCGAAMVILDETYHHFLKKSDVDLIKEFENLCVVQSFSKLFGLAGLRLGYIISNRKNIENLRKVILPFPVNSLAVIAGIAALADKNYIEKTVKKIDEEKEFLKNGLEGKVFQTQTNFLLVNFGRLSSRIHQKLMEKNILVKDLNSYPLLEGYLRITVGTREENKILLETLKRIMPPEAILFDMDGVLVDVSSSYRLAIKETAEHFLKMEIDPEEIKYYKKKGYNDDWKLTKKIISSHGGTVPLDKVIKKFQSLYLNGLIENEKWLLDKELLTKLKKEYKTGIVTGRPYAEAKYALEKFRVEKFFDALIAKEDAPEKPDPSGINLALEKLGVKRAVYIGDNIDDVKAAKSAGVTSIAIGEKNLLEAGAKIILKNVNDIEDVL